MVYGTTLRLPGEMIIDIRVTGELDPNSYVTRLRTFMSNLQPATSRDYARTEHIHPDLFSSPFVFVRVDAVKRPLQPPYDGPYRVLSRQSKYFVLDKNGVHDSVSVDRLKPAFVPADSSAHPTVHSPPVHHQHADLRVPQHPPTSSTQSFSSPVSSSVPPKHTISGQRVTWPKKSAD